MSGDLGSVDAALGVYPVWTHALFKSGRLDDALKYALDGLRLARQAGRRVEEGRALTSLGLIALESKEPGVAKRYLEDAVVIARETKDRTLEARAIANLANSAAYIQRDYETARTYYEQAYALNIELGDRYAQGIARGNIGWVCAMLGDFTAAQKHHEQALVIAREIGNLHHETYTLMNLSGVAEAQGNAQEAVQYAAQANELCRAKNDKQSEAWSWLYLGHAYLTGGQWDEAKKSFEEALSIRTKLGQSSLATEPIAGLIQVSLRTNNLAYAISLLEDLLQHFAEGGNLEGTEEPLRVYLACYSLLERLGDSRSTMILEKAMQLLEAQASKLKDEQTRRMYIENVPWRRTIEQLWLAKIEKD
jgi:tetratricopeptide (TPR) repeat protein